MLITRNLEKIVPNEMGMYLATIDRRNCANLIGGVVRITGPRVSDLSAEIHNKHDNKSLRARELLTINLEEAKSLVNFGEWFFDACTQADNDDPIEVKTIAKLVDLTQRIVKDPHYGKFFQTLFSASLQTFGSSLDAGRLFSRTMEISKNPIEVSVDISKYEINMDLQAFIKNLSQMTTRLSYDSLGGQGVATLAGEDVKEEDVLLVETRNAVNSVCIPLRRSLAIAAINVKKVSLDFFLDVKGDFKKQAQATKSEYEEGGSGAYVNVVCQNVLVSEQCKNKNKRDGKVKLTIERANERSEEV